MDFDSLNKIGASVVQRLQFSTVDHFPEEKEAEDNFLAECQVYFRYPKLVVYLREDMFSSSDPQYVQSSPRSKLIKGHYNSSRELLYASLRKAR
jgi:hypothetical protein